MNRESLDCILAVASLLLLAGIVAEGVAHCKTERSAVVVRAFRTSHPCPSTGKTTGSCGGFVVDHLIPLCWNPDGDTVDNMQWQSFDDAKKKDEFEREACAMKRKCAAKEGEK